MAMGQEILHPIHTYNVNVEDYFTHTEGDLLELCYMDKIIIGVS